MSKAKDFDRAELAVFYTVDETFDSDKFIKMRLRIAHDGVNPNKSSFQIETFENAKESIYNIPILANIIYDENGTPQFGGHDMALEPDKINEGEYKVIYKEVPIGVIPESCNYSIEEYNGKQYVFADAYIYRGYSNYAEDIIERDDEIKISMEIMVDAASFNAKEKIYTVNAFRYMGVTFLNKEYGTGMEDARAVVNTFTESDDNKTKLLEIMAELKNVLATFRAKDEIVEEGDEAVGANIQNEEKFVKSFELSHEDVRYALYALLSAVEAADNEWYFIDRVYDGYFEYENWGGTKIYRQSYIKGDENIAFDGERIELFDERLTKEEKEQLDQIRASYESIKSEFETYKETHKTDEVEVDSLRQFKDNKIKEDRNVAEIEIFSKFDEQLGDNEEYKALKENAYKYEIEDVAEKCYSILGKTTTKFSLNKFEKLVSFGVDISGANEDSYGGLFAKYQKRKY
jgi:hypothetical protein